MSHSGTSDVRGQPSDSYLACPSRSRRNLACRFPAHLVTIIGSQSDHGGITRMTGSTPGLCRPRRRWLYALFGSAVMALGLLSRSEFLSLTPFLAKYAGDALWALL